MNDEVSNIPRMSSSERVRLLGLDKGKEKVFYYQTDNVFEVHRNGRRIKMTPEDFSEYKRFMGYE